MRASKAMRETLLKTGPVSCQEFSLATAKAFSAAIELLRVASTAFSTAARDRTLLATLRLALAVRAATTTKWTASADSSGNYTLKLTRRE